jgi:hypothetical protein
MTANTTKTLWPLLALRDGTPQTEPATAAAVATAISVAPANGATAPVPTNNHALGDGESAPSRVVRLRGAAPRKRKAASAEPLAKFRATGIATWDMAQDYEWAATFCVGHFGLVNARQLGEWVFKDLATPAARHRQAQALTLRLCPQARAASLARRLATAGHRPVLRTLGRKKVGNRFYYYLNAAGQRHMQQNYGLALPDASKALTTASDMAKRALLFEHCLALHRADKNLSFVGPAALVADVARQQAQAPLEPLQRAFLSCLSNLWGAVSANGKLTYLYVADRPGSSNGANVAHYRELAKAVSLLLERAIGIEVIGRRMPLEPDCSLSDTQLARSIVTASAKEVFLTKKTGYRADKLVKFFASLKPHEARIRLLMVRDRA